MRGINYYKIYYLFFYFILVKYSNNCVLIIININQHHAKQLQYISQSNSLTIFIININKSNRALKITLKFVITQIRSSIITNISILIFRFIGNSYVQS
jgi:hypothetical protein